MDETTAKVMFPADFINDLHDSLGTERADRIVAALSAEPEVSVRVNPFKLSLKALREHFGPLAGDPVPWAADEAFYLTERPSFTLDPLFHAGAYYVQEASSMYVGALFERVKAALADGAGGASGLRVLDLCAAPGGKTTQLLSHLDSASLLVANEIVPARATVLAENVVRWGCSNVAVTSSDPAAFGALRGFFDVAVVDAPCSGEGMFRKDERAVAEWSRDNVRLCAARQRRILADAWPALTPGGYLIYSTCTFNRFEDEENVDWIARELGAECLDQRHFYPGEDRGEGFFAALLRKEDGR
jgi:16S rRNA C967 or C1407 C5-methylase (RsmB/RsmF family)